MTRKLLILLVAALSLFGCAGGENAGGKAGPPPPVKPEATVRNAFANGGFENGTAPWFFLEGNPNWLGFSVIRGLAHSGSSSGRILIDAGPEARRTKVYGLIQEVSPPTFPETISGYYRIEKWQRGTPKQYLQFVVIVFGDPLTTKWSNHQIRYLLTGVDKPPFGIGNAKFVIIGSKEPVLGEWVRFERKVSEDFKSLWGWVPSGYEKIRVLFEARYDQKGADASRILAEVYYDDLFFGWNDRGEER